MNEPGGARPLNGSVHLRWAHQEVTRQLHVSRPLVTDPNELKEHYNILGFKAFHTLARLYILNSRISDNRATRQPMPGAFADAPVRDAVQLK